jgi:WD40 repeat protein
MMPLMGDQRRREDDPIALEATESATSTPEPKPRAMPLPVRETDHYSVDAEHARGGIGRVLKAHDRRLRRPVALKELISDTPDARRRFLREAELTARLQHPSIVPIYEVGTWPDGRPFYAMKFISGRSLKELIAAAPTLDARLSLLPHVIAVAEAITYAHSHRIIHRDLKPTNVVVGEFGETMVVDWGLGKDLGAPDDRDASGATGSPDPAHTAEGSVVGTPAFMAPEQAAGQPVDERADVYAIGAILYNVLIGSAPYSGERIADVLADVIAQTAPPIDRVEPGVPRDLATIVNKAMARDPARRYPSARELAADLKRFQTGQLVSAHSYSAAVRLMRWVARNRRLVASGLGFLIALAIIATFSVRRIVREQRVAAAERARAEARARELTLVEARLSLDRDPTASIAWLKTASVDDQSFAEMLSIAAEARARGVARAVLGCDGCGALATPRFSADGSRVYFEREAPGFFSVKLPDPTRLQFVQTPAARMNNFERVLDGSHLVASAETGELIDFGPKGVKVLGKPGLPQPMIVGNRSHDVATCGLDGSVKIWNLDAGAPRTLAKLSSACSSASWSADDSLFAATGNDHATRIWDVASGAPRQIPAASGPHRSFEWSPSGKWAVAVELNGDFRAFDLSTGRVRSLPDPIRGPLVFHGFLSGDRFYGTDLEGGFRVWPLQGGPMKPLRGHSAKIESLASSVDGSRLITCSEDATARIWDKRSLRSRVLRGHVESVLGCSLSADGAWAATVGTDSTLRLWQVGEDGTRELVGSEDDVYTAAFSPDGSTLVIGYSQGETRSWNIATGESAPLPGHHDFVSMVTFSSDGSSVASSSWDGTVRVTEPGRGTSTEYRHPSRVDRLALTRDGRTLATSCQDGKVRVFRVGDPRPRLTLDAHPGGARFVVLSPDERTLASAGEDGYARLWDLESGTQKLALKHDQAHLTGLAFAHDGSMIVTSDADGTLRTWDAQTGAALQVLRGHSSRIHFRVAPDGRHATTWSDDQTVRLWDLESGASQVLLGHHGQVQGAAYSPDGRLLASVGQDGTVRLWDARDGRLRMLWRYDQGPLMYVVFSPDGNSLAVTGWNGQVRVIPIDESRFLPSSPAALRAWLDELSAAVVIPGGRIRSNPEPTTGAAR